jgi:cytochrome c
MHMKFMLAVLVIGSTLLLTAVAHAAGQATPDEAKAMAIKAAEYLKAVGPEKAFPEFSAKDGHWHDRDLYVIVQNNQGVMVEHSTNPGLVGRNVLDLKDPEGKPFNRETQAVKDAGWVNFKWQNPVTKTVEAKTQYIIRVGDYLVGVGAYAQ